MGLADVTAFLSVSFGLYPPLITLFRTQIKEIGFSRHESALPYLISSAALFGFYAWHGCSGPVALLTSVALALATYKWQITGPSFKPVPMDGKVCIVTGSSSGIGLDTAKELYRMGAHVILGARRRGCRGGVPPANNATRAARLLTPLSCQRAARRRRPFPPAMKFWPAARRRRVGSSTCS